MEDRRGGEYGKQGIFGPPFTKKKKKKIPLLHLHNVFHPFTLVTLIESCSLLPNVSALQKEQQANKKGAKLKSVARRKKNLLEIKIKSTNEGKPEAVNKKRTSHEEGGVARLCKS